MLNNVTLDFGMSYSYDKDDKPVVSKAAASDKVTTYTFDETKSAPSTQATYDKIEDALLKSDDGESIITGCDDVSYTYIGASGGSKDTAWEIKNCIKY
mgnify:CR=1 FL=1